MGSSRRMVEAQSDRKDQFHKVHLRPCLPWCSQPGTAGPVPLKRGIDAALLDLPRRAMLRLATVRFAKAGMLLPLPCVLAKSRAREQW